MKWHKSFHFPDGNIVTSLNLLSRRRRKTTSYIKSPLITLIIQSGANRRSNQGVPVFEGKRECNLPANVIV